MSLHNLGSVWDIQISLQYNPSKESVLESIKGEKAGKNRKTVLKMFEAYLKRLEKKEAKNANNQPAK